MTIKVVDVKTDSFEGVFLAMSELPGEDVMEAISSEGGAQMIKVYQMFKFAALDQMGIEAIENLPYGEMSSAIDQWTKPAKTRDVVWE